MRRPVSILAALLLAAPFVHAEVAASASGSLARFMDGEIAVPSDWHRELEEAEESMPQSYLFTGAPTSAPIAPEEAVTPAPSPEEEDPTAVTPPSGPTAGPEEEGQVDAQGLGGDSSGPPPPAGGSGGDADSASSSGSPGGDGGEVTSEAAAEPEATPESETPAATPEGPLEPVGEPVAPAADTPTATPAPSEGTAVPVTTILLELAGSTTQQLQATTVIVAEVERVLNTKATYSSARRALANAVSSTPFFPPAVRRALQETTTAGALCANAETPKSEVTITLSNYDNTAAVNTLLKEIVEGTRALTIDGDIAVRDTICKEEVSLKMVSIVTPVSPMDDVAKEESTNSSGLGKGAVAAIAVLVPATVLLFIFFAYRRRSNSRVAQV